MSAVAKRSSQPQIKLAIQKGPHAGQRFVFSKNKITIGRSPENDIILVNDPLISRQHAFIEVNQNDIEIVNLSVKNPILVNQEKVNRWKLTSDTIFMIGDTEFLIQIENQQSVLVVKPNPAALVPKANAVPKNNLKLVAQTQKTPQVFSQMTTPAQAHQQAPPRFYPPPSTADSIPKGKVIFYVIIAILIGAGLFLYIGDRNSSTSLKNKKVSTLKYADETAMKLNSQDMADAFKKQEKMAEMKQRAPYLRAEENFSKAMRSFQLGNYENAAELFQQALATNPEHVLAKRYLYLAKVRFDEIVKAKLELGQSYFERNNFKLCKSQFQQVVDMLSSKEMLQGPSKDTNLQLARTMLKKCEFAAEGIH